MNKNQIISDLKRVASELGKAPTRTDYHRGGMGRATEHNVKTVFGSFSEALVAAGLIGKALVKVNSESGFLLAKAKEEISGLKGYISELEGETLNAKRLRELIGSMNCDTLGKDTDWLKGPKMVRSNVTGIPTLFLSDLHFDENVKSEQIGFMNKFNHDIAVARVQHTFRTAVILLKKHMVSPKYDGIVCALGGDMLSGIIHEELAETNDAAMNQSLLSLTDLLITGIEMLADEFKKVFIPCVVGNHGRLHRKPRMKNRVYDNFEWLIYQWLIRYFKNDDRISFLVPDGADALFQLYDRRICLTHGDQFRGGEGVGGIMVPIMRGIGRKQSREAGVGRRFDLTMMGHWHQYIHMQNILINGSLKGYDEYDYIYNFPFERPQQALFITHPEKGITFRMPILCDGYEQAKPFDRSKPKVSW